VNNNTVNNNTVTNNTVNCKTVDDNTSVATANDARDPERALVQGNGRDVRVLDGLLLLGVEVVVGDARVAVHLELVRLLCAQHTRRLEDSGSVLKSRSMKHEA
jgi:hypothetical protein